MGGACLTLAVCLQSPCYFSKDPVRTFSRPLTAASGTRRHCATRFCRALPWGGVDVFLGHGAFDDAELCVDGLPINTRIALCTGASAAVPPIPGLVEAQPLTNETVFDLQEAPASLAILGAGAIGCELAQVFARLDVNVSLFELADRVLPNETPRASAAVAAALDAAGVTLFLGQGVHEVRGAGTIVCGDTQVTCERVLVALGRKPNPFSKFRCRRSNTNCSRAGAD